ncbi:MAG: phosphoribosyl-AMP cyclohydrolase [Armatimonadota bacterium]|nr:phosphoribosyl-AMP cyclohydrolase [Armatimonadota bacterium]
MSFSDDLKYDDNGLIPAIVQDAETGELLMVAYMNKESVDKTLESGKTCFWSRSRKEFWVKGGSSGHFQFVKGVYTDCDKDCLLIKVEQKGAACHDGYRSCFYRRVAGDGSLEIIAEKVFNPDEVYKK